MDTFSKSKKSVFRGLHGDNKTWKLISCLFGEIHLTVLNPKTKKIARFKLDSSTRNQVLVPNDCENGHYCLSDECLFSYKMTERYGGIKVNTPLNGMILNTILAGPLTCLKL